MPRFDETALRKTAGEAVFARGVDYARRGKVRLVSVQSESVRAEVTGTELYAVVLKGSGRAFSGGCECPAFDDRGFCKHLVAVALVVNGAPDAVAQAAEHSRQVAAHLNRLDRPALIAKLMAWAEHDPQLWRELELEASIAAGSDEAVFARLAAAIDAALDLDEVDDWRGAGAVAEELDGVIEQIQRVMAGGRTVVALRALDRLLDDAEELFEAVDDSDGEIGDALARVRDLHVDVCVAAKPDPIELAQTLFERELGSDFGFWDDCGDLYADALGPRGAAELRRLVNAAWRETSGGGDRTRSRLRDMLDGIARREGDVDARIELRAADARTAWDYHQIASLCLDAGRDREALRWAEEGLWKSEDKPDARLIALAARICRRVGDDGKAQALLWDAFERAPGLDNYKQLKQGPAPPADLVDPAIALLTDAAAAGRRRTWQNPADVLVEVLMLENRRDEAWTAVRAHPCAETTLEALALSSEQSHPDEALTTYARLAEQSLCAVNNAGYARAIGYIARIGRLRSRLGRGDEQAAYLADLAVRHKAKRNFIKLLNDRPHWPKA